MPRDSQGKFARKNDEHRLVRSLRLTQTTWSALGALAASRELTKADLLEQMFGNNGHCQPSHTRQEQESLPCNTRQSEASQPRKTPDEEEIRQLRAEVAALRCENAQLRERVDELTLTSKLEVVRERVLSGLKLGKQAPGYRTAKLALNQFMTLLRSQA
jgi:uncharacterized membrane protein YgaE (UPF0421/DUF939 family)